MSVAIVEKSLEVFQDLKLHGPAEQQALLRRALLESTMTPWRHAEDDEKILLKTLGQESGILVFHREAEDGMAAARLSLWSRPDGYEVVNIVPLAMGHLDHGGYNAILEDFVSRIAMPAARKTAFSVQITSARQTLEDWVSSESALALRHFSRAANKTTGSAHSMDRKRWLRFLLRAHADTKQMDPARLARWLTEIEGWDSDNVHDLITEYEFALELLNEYDLRPN